MSNIKLFSINGKITELPSTSVALERELQILIEKNMNTFFESTFLKTEFKTTNSGRINSFGIDKKE
ncbi:MAG: hypothetical protein ABF289_13390 [Clostridiales bacterium]